MNQDKNKRKMSVGIAGSGAVGCFYGLALQRACLDVLFLARGAHCKALHEHGICLESQGEGKRYPVTSSNDIALLADCDVILLCCKTTQLDAMCRQLLTVIKENTCLLTLQNGVQAADQVMAYFPNHSVLAASVFIGVRIEKPGYIIHSAAGHIRFGHWHGRADDCLTALQRAFLLAGVDAKIEGDMRLMLWKKMLWNCGFNAITGLTKRYARDVALDENMSVWVRSAMLEVVHIAQTMGIALDESMLEQQMQLTCKSGAVKSSMWQDISHQKETEISAMNGYIAAQGKRFGIAVPINSMLEDMIHLAEGVYRVR